MVSNVSKFLKFLLQNKPITKKFYIILMLDATIPEIIKKSIGLYVRGDKRLSIEKLVKNIKSIRKLPRVIKQSGGTNGGTIVYTETDKKHIIMSHTPRISYSPFAKDAEPIISPFAKGEPMISAFAGYKFDSIDSIKFIEQPSIISATKSEPFDIQSFIGASGYTVNKTAQGGNGMVYMLSNTKEQSDIVIKTVANTYKIVQMLKSTHTFKEHIQISETTCPGEPIANINTLSDIKDKYNWFNIYENPAYAMPYYNGNLTDYIVNIITKSTKPTLQTINEQLLDVIIETRMLLPDSYARNHTGTQYSFTHCDIKLDNILINKGNSPILHDMDTVVVYEISKIDNTYLQGVDFTPLFAHPLFVYLTDGSPSTTMDDDTTLLNPWQMYIRMSHGAFSRNPIIDKFLEIIKGMWNDATKKVRVDTTNLHGILQYCDVYSLGASVMMTALNNELRLNYNPTKKTQYDLLYLIGQELIRFAFANLPTKSGGSIERLSQYGTTNTKTITNPQLLRITSNNTSAPIVNTRLVVPRENYMQTQLLATLNQSHQKPNTIPNPNKYSTLVGPNIYMDINADDIIAYTQIIKSLTSDLSSIQQAEVIGQVTCCVLRNTSKSDVVSF